jgi:hypothetical protein
MWNTMFAIAIAASVWFSAASLAVEFNKQRATFLAAMAKPPAEQTYREAESAKVGDEQQPASRLD